MLVIEADVREEGVAAEGSAAPRLHGGERALDVAFQVGDRLPAPAGVDVTLLVLEDVPAGAEKLAGLAGWGLAKLHGDLGVHPSIGRIVGEGERQVRREASFGKGSDEGVAEEAETLPRPCGGLSFELSTGDRLSDAEGHSRLPRLCLFAPAFGAAAGASSCGPRTAALATGAQLR
ncbi:MAG: hypothetical protein HYZ53_28860 [Planctomycetes bacterium]|nr:hypothetical protein [Planctomycetota bacterium]